MTIKPMHIIGKLNDLIEQNNADLFCKFMRNNVSILNNSPKAVVVHF